MSEIVRLTPCEIALMHDPKDTKYWRPLIERRKAAYLWGQKRFVVPRLCDEVWGDGKLLLAISPIMYRPQYFVARIDSSWETDNWEELAPGQPDDWLWDIEDAIADEYLEWPWAERYGLRWSDDDDAELNSRIDWSDGCEWWERKWPGE